MKDHKELFSFVSGFSDAQRTKKTEIDDVYLLWSMSKVITSVAVLRLIEKGKLSLSDTLDSFFPEFKNAFYFENWKKITVKKRPIFLSF